MIRLCCYPILDKTFVEVFEIAECARSSMDRASDFGSEGWGFKSLRAHHIINRLHLLFPFPLQTGHGSRKISSIHRIPKVSWGKIISRGRWSRLGADRVNRICASMINAWRQQEREKQWKGRGCAGSWSLKKTGRSSVWICLRICPLTSGVSSRSDS